MEAQDAPHGTSLARVAGEAQQLLAEAKQHPSVKVALRDARTFENFWLKCLNDWIFNFASALAYSLLMALFPVVLTLTVIVGFASNSAAAHAQSDLIQRLSTLFLAIIGPQGVHALDPVSALLQRNAGFLGILALVLALYNGSRLFVALEDYFDIIYHTRARTFWRQNAMAFGMLLLFLVLIPIMLLASSLNFGGFIGGVLASWVLFVAIYIVVPNQHISLKNSWLGALVAACAFQIYVAVFPWYVRHFLGSYNGVAGFAVILLLFFYYFAAILLLGAEVNAFYAEGIRGTPMNLADLVHQATQARDEQELAELTQQKGERHTTQR